MKSRLVFIAAAIAVLVPLSVFATPVTGELAFTGDVTATFTALNFTCSTGSCSPGQGSFAIDGTASTGTFAGLGGQTGNIMDINNSSTPPGQTVSLSNFLTLPGVSFTLTKLDLGTGGPCPPASGTTCTPTSPALVTPSNPLGKTGTIFEDTSAGAVAEFSVNADAMVTSASGQITPYTGTFSATFNGMTTAQVLADLSSAGSISTPFSATFNPSPTTSTVPEPSTASFAILGLLLLLAGAGVRRFSRC